MKWPALAFLLILTLGCLWRCTEAVCVLDSDFGFKLNCAFKKSGLFRVRNLGGVKGYVGLGFSVGDSLGFEPSLESEDTKRRSVPSGRSANIGVQTFAAQHLAAMKKAELARMRAATSRPAPAAPMVTVPPFRPLPPDAGGAAAPPNPQPGSVLQQQVGAGMLVAPANMSRPSRLVAVPSVVAVPVPPFQALPPSIARLPVNQDPNVVGVHVVRAPLAFRNSLQVATNHFMVRKDAPPTANDGGLSTNTLTLRTGSSPPEPAPGTMAHSIKTLAKAANVTEEAIAAAIALRQQQLQQAAKTTTTTTTTTTSTTTAPPPSSLPPKVTRTRSSMKKYPLASPSKVMNAPKEYYPVAYDKNFDDNFTSKVELPETSFYCGDQKHFPGLYADEDLGCMVFHVCAFTDDGLIMKSFLCPESTLFDQTILKCNWWFYVDCKASKRLYDSNIPISKSYQLMKALTFFSSYNKSS